MAHSTSNYKSGGGLLYLAKWSTTTTPPTSYAIDSTDWYDVGNAQSYTTEPTVTKKKHKSRRTSTEKTDVIVKVKEECMVKFTLDEPNRENLRMFFEGTLNDTTGEINPMQSGIQYYGIKFIEKVASGESYTHIWWKADITASAALESIIQGDGDGDWQQMELDCEILSDEDNHASNPFGSLTPTPTT